jgi:hypothetical protein
VKSQIRIRNTDFSYSIESLCGLQSIHLHSTFLTKTPQGLGCQKLVPKALFMVPQCRQLTFETVTVFKKYHFHLERMHAPNT